MRTVSADLNEDDKDMSNLSPGADRDAATAEDRTCWRPATPTCVSIDYSDTGHSENAVTVIFFVP